jgi:hypothetical protein
VSEKAANKVPKLIKRKARFLTAHHDARVSEKSPSARGPTLIARMDLKKCLTYFLHYSDDVQEFTTANVHGVLQELCNAVQP